MPRALTEHGRRRGIRVSQRSLSRLLIVFTGLWLATSCGRGDLVEPEQFGFRVADAPASGDLPRLDAVQSDRTIELHGALPANLCASVVRPEAHREQHAFTLTLYVEGRPGQDDCPTSPRMIEYFASIENVPVGRFTILVYWMRQQTNTPGLAGAADIQVE